MGDHRLEVPAGLLVARDVRHAKLEQLVPRVSEQLARREVGRHVTHLLVRDQDRDRSMLDRISQQDALNKWLGHRDTTNLALADYDRLMPRPSWAPDALSLFVELAALPSPPGEERAVADRVLDYLQALGLEAEEDDAGARIGSTIGNILCRLEPRGNGGGAPLFFCAHLDTVQPEAAIEPVVGEDGFVRNAAGTILGADDKSAVAAMLEAAGSAGRGGAPACRRRAAFHPEGRGRSRRSGRLRRVAADRPARLRLRPRGPGR